MSAAGRSIEQIFADMDQDGNGEVTQKEFRNGMRQLGIGLTSKEIDKIMQRIDENGDGVIDYQEFFAILGANLGFDRKMVERANNKLADLKEKMQKYMTSHGDAYRTFDASQVGKMSFTDFNLLVTEIARVSNTPAPAYAVIKDLFDAVDMKKDGHIDQQEWN
jgi:Ca2+-binding EF-hand superfamily protein